MKNDKTSQYCKMVFVSEYLSCSMDLVIQYFSCWLKHDLHVNLMLDWL